MEIKKKSGLSINPDNHHSKVPSSDVLVAFKIVISQVVLWRSRSMLDLDLLFI